MCECECVCVWVSDTGLSGHPESIMVNETLSLRVNSQTSRLATSLPARLSSTADAANTECHTLIKHKVTSGQRALLSVQNGRSSPLHSCRALTNLRL